MTGWGQDGPWAHSAGDDINYVAVTGALGAIGREGGPPQIPLNLLGDSAGGSLYLVVGVLAAVLEARVSGLGQVIDCAIVDGVSSLASMMWEMRSAGDWGDARGTNLLDGGRPFYDVYETADGGWGSRSARWNRSSSSCSSTCSGCRSGSVRSTTPRRGRGCASPLPQSSPPGVEPNGKRCSTAPTPAPPPF